MRTKDSVAGVDELVVMLLPPEGPVAITAPFCVIWQGGFTSVASADHATVIFLPRTTVVGCTDNEIVAAGGVGFFCSVFLF